MTTNQIAYYKAKQETAHWERSDQETQRHNVRAESLSEQANAINQAHYERSDSETARHNAAAEDISRTEAETHRLNLYETVRHNQSTEQLGWATYGETVRHNKASEGLGYANVALGYANLAETSAHNRNTEYLSGLQLDETNRHNVELENQTRPVNESQANLNWWKGDVAMSEKYLNEQRTEESSAQTEKLKIEQGYMAGESYSRQFSNYASALYNLTGAFKNFIAFGGTGSNPITVYPKY